MLFQLKERINVFENGNNTTQFQANNKYNTNNCHKNTEYQINNITDINMTQDLIDDDIETDVTLIPSDITNSDVDIIEINARHNSFNNVNDDEKLVLNECDTPINISMCLLPTPDSINDFVLYFRINRGNYNGGE